jgi:WbqC-like protein family
MQPYFFPYLGYFSLIESSDKFVIYDDVNFIKGGWINRNYFLGTNGSFRFTLPVSHTRQNTKIYDVKLCDLSKTKDQLFRTLSFNYKKAPFFHETMNLLNVIFRSKEQNLADFLTITIKKIAEYSGLTTDIFRSSDLNIGVNLTGQERILEICQTMKAKLYINAIGGSTLYRVSDFVQNGIALKFVKFSGVAYPQFSQQHIPNLSIIDSMMFNSPDHLLFNIRQYKLVDGVSCKSTKAFAASK